MVRTGTAGLGLAVLSAATFGTAGTFGSALIDAGWTPGAAVTARVSIAAGVLAVPAALSLRGRWRALWHAAPVVLAYGLLAVAGAQLFFFQALQHLSVGVALLLEYSGTLLVVAWLWAVHGQRPRRLTVCGALLAIGGMVLVLDLTGSQRVDLVGVLWGLGAAVGLAAYFMISARTDDSLPPLVTAAGGLLTAAVVLGVACLTGLLRWRAVAADTRLAGHAVSWLVPLLGVSLVAAVIAYVTGIAAARRLGARLASFVGLAEVLFAVLIAWVALGQRPGVLQAVGGVVVLIGIALVRADERDPEAPAGNGPDVNGALEIPLAGASPAPGADR
jgi:drug/metabolite transporter (DMT)-like permease